MSNPLSLATQLIACSDDDARAACVAAMSDEHLVSLLEPPIEGKRPDVADLVRGAMTLARRFRFCMSPAQRADLLHSYTDAECRALRAELPPNFLGYGEALHESEKMAEREAARAAARTHDEHMAKHRARKQGA